MTTFSRRRWWKSGPPPTLAFQLKDGDIVHGDVLEFLNALKDESADIVFLDPPFNLGKTYGRAASGDRMDEAEYEQFMKEVVARSCKILKPGGALYLYHIPKRALALAATLQAELSFRHWIAIAMKNGFMRGTDRLYPAHYALLYFTKGIPSRFSRPKVLPPVCRHCTLPIKDYGGYKRFVIDGVNLSDFWDDISPVRHRKYKTRSANELPLTITRRIVQISGGRNAVLVDPFAGTGTSLVAAREAGMRFVACDRERKACELARRRLEDHHETGER